MVRNLTVTLTWQLTFALCLLFCITHYNKIQQTCDRQTCSCTQMLVTGGNRNQLSHQDCQQLKKVSTYIILKLAKFCIICPTLVSLLVYEVPSLETSPQVMMRARMQIQFARSQLAASCTARVHFASESLVKYSARKYFDIWALWGYDLAQDSSYSWKLLHPLAK